MSGASNPGRAWLEINPEVLASNYSSLASGVSPAEVLCVVKANAYGMGAISCAGVLADAGCRRFGVADSEEAVELVDALAGRGCIVQMLSSVLPREIPDMVLKGVVLPVWSYSSAKAVSDAAVRCGRTAKVHFKVDSGMGRLGCRLDEAYDELVSVLSLPGLDVEGVYSHFSSAGDPEDPYTQLQLDSFKSFVLRTAAAGMRFEKVHIGASDGVNNFPVCAEEPFNLVRIGINLHGGFTPEAVSVHGLRQTFSFKARVVQTRRLKAGAPIGYCRSAVLREDTVTAVVAAGYADGIPLALSNRGSVIVGSRLCPVVGRVSMDYTVVDVGGCAEVSPGDEVVFLGSSGGFSISPADWAGFKGVHAYEILCSIGQRVERRFVK